MLPWMEIKQALVVNLVEVINSAWVQFRGDPVFDCRTDALNTNNIISYYDTGASSKASSTMAIVKQMMEYATTLEQKEIEYQQSEAQVKQLRNIAQRYNELKHEHDEKVVIVVLNNALGT